MVPPRLEGCANEELPWVEPAARWWRCGGGGEGEEEELKAPSHLVRSGGITMIPSA